MSQVTEAQGFRKSVFQSIAGYCSQNPAQCDRRDVNYVPAHSWVCDIFINHNTRKNTRLFYLSTWNLVGQKDKTWFNQYVHRCTNAYLCTYTQSHSYGTPNTCKLATPIYRPHPKPFTNFFGKNKSKKMEENQQYILKTKLQCLIFLLFLNLGHWKLPEKLSCVKVRKCLTNEFNKPWAYVCNFINNWTFLQFNCSQVSIPFQPWHSSWCQFPFDHSVLSSQFSQHQVQCYMLGHPWEMQKIYFENERKSLILLNMPV